MKPTTRLKAGMICALGAALAFPGDAIAVCATSDITVKNWKWSRDAG